MGHLLAWQGLWGPGNGVALWPQCVPSVNSFKGISGAHIGLLPGAAAKADRFTGADKLHSLHWPRLVSTPSPTGLSSVLGHRPGGRGNGFLHLAFEPLWLPLSPLHCTARPDTVSHCRPPPPAAQGVAALKPDPAYHSPTETLQCLPGAYRDRLDSLLAHTRTFMLARPTQPTSGPLHVPFPQLERPLPWISFGWLSLSLHSSLCPIVISPKRPSLTTLCHPLLYSSFNSG